MTLLEPRALDQQQALDPRCQPQPGQILPLSTELERPSPIFFGFDIESTFVEELSRHSFDKLFFFAEEHVFNLLGRDLFEELKRRFDCTLRFVPVGEQSKRFPILEEICESLIAQDISKKSILIAFGGGAVGNIVGLAAGLVYRGIRYVEVPTTMTGQTDSTLSNKQAVNGRRGKNHFGLYHSPLFIWSDVKYLRTEPASSRRSGLVEAIKNGFISDPGFLDYLEDALNPELDFTDAGLTELTYRVILSKLAIIRRDPSEKREGIILEYGHTFGHAIEWLQKSALSHGESVGIGMKIAANLAKELGLITQDVVDRHEYLIDSRLGLDVQLPHTLTADAMLAAMSNDNKRTGRGTRFVLLSEIGRCHDAEGDFLVTVEPLLVRRVIDEFIENQRRRIALVA